MHRFIYIKGKINNAVIISENNYESIQETMYVNSVLESAKVIMKAKNMHVDEYISYEQ